MKILFVGYKHDYKNTWEITKRNFGNDYFLWWETLLRITQGMNHELQSFWIDEMIVQKGRKGMNEALQDFIFLQRPTVILVCSGYWDIDRTMLARVQKQSSATSIYICGDDSWRFDSLSKFYAPYFSWVLTWCSSAVKKYKKIGYENIISSQPWVDINIYKPADGPKDIDVSFVGTRSGPREKIVDALRAAGINILVRGNGWPEGGVSQDEMIDIISRSRIGLSLNPAAFYFSWRSIMRLFFRRAEFGEKGRSIKFDGHHFFRNVREWLQKRERQIKARSFEIPACRTMQMTQDADNLREYYLPDKEIVLYDTTENLIKKIKYYLAHHAEREQITFRGYERTIREHTAEVRLAEIFLKIGHPLV
jgi:spore maturation protein CgeB